MWLILDSQESLKEFKAYCLFYASFKEKGFSEKGLILNSGEKFI